MYVLDVGRDRVLEVAVEEGLCGTTEENDVVVKLFFGMAGEIVRGWLRRRTPEEIFTKEKLLPDYFIN